MTKIDYRYDECGLDNVILHNLTVMKDDNGDDCVHIPHVNALHRVIVGGLIAKESALLPKEMRFLRTELGLTQAQLAQIVSKDAQSIGRWERGEHPIEPSADTLVRVLATQHLGSQCDLPPIEQLARRSMTSTDQRPLIIDASNPKDYKLVA